MDSQNLRDFEKRLKEIERQYPREARLLDAITRVAHAKVVTRAMMEPEVPFGPVDGWLDGFVFGMLLQRVRPETAESIQHSRVFFQARLNDSIVEILEQQDKDFLLLIDETIRKFVEG